MTRVRLLLACGVAAAIGGAYWMGRARAGIPTTTPLYYSGYLEDSNGPVSDSKAITVNLFDSQSQGQAICPSSPSGNMASLTQVTAGRFRIPLDSGCTAALQNKTDVWVEVNVEGQALARSKIGAVPYALSAGNVDWSGVGGVAATTEWPGTVPYSRVSGRPVYTNPTTKKTYSLDAGYCGTSAQGTGNITAPGGLTGYAATKAVCEATCNSPTAHMCTAIEMIRFVATGGTIANPGYYSSGVWSMDPGSNRQADDCSAWTSSNGDPNGHIGARWQPLPLGPNVSTCSGLNPILCCD